MGWSAAALYWAYIGFIGTGFSWWLAVLHFVTDLLIYILPSHLYRNLSLKYQWQKLSIPKLLVRILPSIFILGFIFMLLTIVKNYTVRLYFQPGFTETFSDNLKASWLTTFVTGIRLMAIWVLAYYGYHYAQREINAVKESARLTIIAKDAAFNNLSAQLNPHFFFNSLNSIKSLVIENPGAARRAIDLLSDLLRTSLYERDKTLIPLKDEIALVNDYLELEKIRFEKKLVPLFDIDQRLLEVPVLPLSVQVLVENAIKHGIAQKKEGGQIYINIQRKDNNLAITVQNPGIYDEAGTIGVGLANLRERLRLQFNGTASFHISRQPGETVSATIIMPLV